jgi:hypothetical protein
MHHAVRNFNGRMCLDFSQVLAAVAANCNSRVVSCVLFDERYTTKVSPPLSFEA